LKRHYASAVRIALQAGVIDNARVARLVQAPVGREERLRHPRDARVVRRAAGLECAAVREELPALRAPVFRIRAAQDRVLPRALASNHDMAAPAEELRAAGDADAIVVALAAIVAVVELGF